MKTIKVGSKTIELVRHASEEAKPGKQRYEAGRDAAGGLWFKGRTGRWSAAYQTKTLAEEILARGL